MKRWVIIFRALANINRLKIIKMLAKSKSMTVSQITEELEISFKATSNHLVILKNLAILENKGEDGHVYYSRNSKLPKDAKQAINLIKN